MFPALALAPAMPALLAGGAAAGGAAAGGSALFGTLLGLGGAGLGAAASAMGANSANSAMSQRAAGASAEAEAARRRLGLMLYGPNDWRDLSMAMQPETYQQTKKRGGLGGFLGGTKTRTIDQTAAVRAAQNRFFGRYGSLQDQISAVNSAYGRDVEAANQAQGLDFDRLDRMAAEGEGAARDFEASSRARSAYHTDRARQAADQRATASLGMFGGSLLGNQLAGNARAAGNDLLDQYAGIEREGTARFQQARANRLGILGGAMAGRDASRRNLASVRYQGAREPIDMRGALFNSGAFQPYTPLLASAGQSSTGNALGTLAPLLSGLGGFFGGR